jgi:predicted Zn-dependent peptidase
MIPLLLSAFIASGLGGAQETTPPHADNPFAGFETVTLSNGMRLWLRILPGAADVSVGVSVPYGWDMDPAGKEELAHFTEHMLFSDHRGVSEQEIKDQVESRGGSRNGLTTTDHTFYYVTLPAREGLFGLEWLSRVMEPHAMDPDVVERNRQPVALEIGARPWEIGDRVASWLNPSWLNRPGFWEREFGLTAAREGGYDRWASLHAITPDDLKGFYERYYAPEVMTLVVVGDLDRDSVVARAEATFGQLPDRSAPPAYGPLVDPARPDRFILWAFRPNVRYRRIFKIYEMDAVEHARLIFLARYLDRRLSARLRFGETKAVYGVSTTIHSRGPASYLVLDAPIDPEQWTFARDIIEEELGALADGTIPPEDFRADRDAVIERLIAENREAQDLVFWVYRSFHRPDIHASFPDLPTVFSSLEVDELATFVRGILVPDREILSIRRPHPLSQGVLGLIAIALAFFTVRGTRRLLTRPVEMKRIRYVARLHLSSPVVAVGGTLYVTAGVVLARLAVAGVDRIGYAWILQVDMYLFQMGAWALSLVGGLFGVLVYLSLPPRKLLVFPDHVRVKNLFYRSRVIPIEDIHVVRRARIFDVARDGLLFRTLPLSWGLASPAVHLQPRHGLGYLARVRDSQELLDVLDGLGAPVMRPD